MKVPIQRREEKSFFDHFPMPKLLQVPAVGIDISDSTIKLIEFTRSKKAIALKQFADRKIEKGIVESGEIKNPKELAKALADIKRRYNISSAHASLPEERAYLFESEFSKTENQKLRDVIEFHLEENVPISVSEAVFDYDVIEILPKDRVKVGVSVMPREVVEKYNEAFERSEIWLESLEVEAQSIARSVIPDGDDEAHIIADFGRTRTGVAIVSDGIVRFTSTIEIGGDHFTQVIMEENNIEKKPAEELKEKKGINQEGAALQKKLEDLAAKFASELERHLRFWETHSRGGDDGVKKVVLCGGNATVPGVRERLAHELGVSVVVPDVWQNAFDINEHLPPIRKGDSLSFATSVGLALKTFKE